MKITTGGTGIISSQSSTTAATLGAGGLVNPSFQYSWAINCAIAEPFNPGQLESYTTYIPDARFGTTYWNITQTTGDNGGWDFVQHTPYIGGFFRVGFGEDVLTGVGVSSAPVDAGIISTTNKYFTIDYTINSLGNYDPADYASLTLSGGAAGYWVPDIWSDTNVVLLGSAAIARPPSHINGNLVAGDADRNQVSGLKSDGSETLLRTSMTWDLSRDTDLSDTYNFDRLRWYILNLGSGSPEPITYPFNITFHSFIFGPEPPPQLVTQLDVSNPV